MYEVAFHNAGDSCGNLTETILYNDPDMNSITETPAAWKQVEDGKVWMGHPPSGPYGNHDDHHYMHFIMLPETVKMVQASDHQEGKCIYYFSIHWGEDSGQSTSMKSFVARMTVDLEIQKTQDAWGVVVVTEFHRGDGSLIRTWPPTIEYD